MASIFTHNGVVEYVDCVDDIKYSNGIVKVLFSLENIPVGQISKDNPITYTPRMTLVTSVECLVQLKQHIENMLKMLNATNNTPAVVAQVRTYVNENTVQGGTQSLLQLNK